MLSYWVNIHPSLFLNDMIADVAIRDDLLVEVDVILPQSSTLHFAHDIGETIQ